MSELRPVGKHPEAPSGDIVFVHGLGGHWRETWMADPHDDRTFWPLWLARDLPACRIWSLDYEADLSAWGGSVMDIEEHADIILEILKVRGLGARPIVFLAHSLGGLVTKALLRAALASKAEAYRRIAEQTRGIVFFATPNSGARLASLAASLLWFLRPSPVLKDMRAHGSALRRLNTWYRDQVTDGTFGGREGVKVFYEKAGILRAPFLIVDETSADPGIPDFRPLALKADHWATCKLAEPGNWLYQSVRDHVVSVATRADVEAQKPNISNELVEARQQVRRLLQQNHEIWKSLGPKSRAALDHPTSDGDEIWRDQKKRFIIPNNDTILEICDRFPHIVADEKCEILLASFRLHCHAFRAHQDNPRKRYPTFPTGFEECFK